MYCASERLHRLPGGRSTSLGLRGLLANVSTDARKHSQGELAAFRGGEFDRLVVQFFGRVAHRPKNTRAQAPVQPIVPFDRTSTSEPIVRLSVTRSIRARALPVPAPLPPPAEAAQ